MSNHIIIKKKIKSFNTKIKVNKHKEKISKALKIKLDDLWAVHVK